MARVHHVMADGTTRESMDGVEIPLTPRTKRYYEILAEAARKNMAEEEAKKDKKAN